MSTIHAPDGKVAVLTLPSTKSRSPLWNDTARAFPQASLDELFTSQFERTPEAVAAICDEKKLTYSELSERVDALARRLRAQDVKPEERVGVYVDRSLDLLISILAIFKAGAVYVLLGPSYPDDRLAFLVTEAQLSVVVTSSDFLEQLSRHRLPAMIGVNADWHPKTPRGWQSRIRIPKPRATTHGLRTTIKE